MEALNRTERHDFWKFKGSQDFVDEWFLMSTPIPVLTLLSVYLLFVLKLGPDYMKKRQPMDLSSLLLFYNFAQVAVSVFIMYVGIKLLMPVGLLHSVCELDADTVLPLSAGIYYYFSAKASELLDTVFFVLRKKDSQITFLHVYHHGMMLLSTWWTLKYEPTYTTIFLGTLNSFIHVIMYAYYALSTFPQLTKYLWWKKYITTMQLVQFLAIIVQVYANYYVSGCPPSTFLLNVIIVNAFLMIYLFSDFYMKAYVKNKKDREQKAKDLLQQASDAKKNDMNFTARIQDNSKHEKSH